MKSRYNVNSLNLSFYTSDEIKKLSAAEVHNPLSFDTFGHPLSHGLYDPRLGPLNERSGQCITCNMIYHDCPGHFGHIKLPVLVYHPLTFDALLLLLNSVCHHCFFFKISQDERLTEYAKLNMLSKGHSVNQFYQEMEKLNKKITETKIHDIEQQTANYIQNDIDSTTKGKKFIVNMSLYDKIECILNKVVPQTFNPNEHHKEVVKFLKFCGNYKKCMNCHKKAQPVKKDKILLVKNNETQEINEIKKIVENVLENEKEILELCFKNFNIDMFFLDSVVVTPTRFRPMSFVNGKQFESAMNEILSKIIRASNIKNKTLIKKNSDKKKTVKKGSEETKSIQDDIDIQDDSDTKSRDEKTTNLSALSKDELENFYNATKSCDEVETNVSATIYEESQTTNNEETVKKRKTEKEIKKETTNVTSEVITSNDTQDYKCGSKEFSDLQYSIYLYFDSSSAPASDRVIGIKQVLEKKEGLFRKHLMGKRVNHAARSVISPDPHLHTREIGIPAVFAETLVFPEKITPYNVEKLRKAIINGPKYPGANFLDTITNDHKIKFDLSKLTEQRRTELANRSLTTDSVVYRHMQNNDIVLVNRQPTLHKPSIMAHRVRVLPGEKTIRMHYANCNSYNADFDGDEMNIHYLQDHMARAEGYLLMANDFNYLVSTNGSPVRGLVQDHVVVMARICLKDEFFTKEEFLQYIVECKISDNKENNTENDDCKTQPNKKNNEFLKYEKSSTTNFYVPKPAILRPVKLYTGKQITSAILKSMSINIDHTSKSKHAEIEDGEVIIRNGYLLKGIIDKNQLGPTNNGLIHVCGEKYGYSICNELLTSFGRVLNKIMIRQGFGARIDEFMLEKDGDWWRDRFCRESEMSGTNTYKNEIIANESAIKDEVNNESKQNDEMNNDNKMNVLYDKNELNDKRRLKDDYYFTDQNTLSYLDACVKSEMSKLTTKIIDLAITKHQFIKYPFNNFSLMVISGAKGSMVNIGQISGLLGQQELEGKRVPLMTSGTSLPCYKSYSLEPQAGGYIFGRFLDGINPSEYYFHCMAGREGLIDTAVKTARSGYLQRCLIKGLEGCKIEYDMSVRCDGDVIQFIYGEDGKPKTNSNKTKSLRYASSSYDPNIPYMLSPGEAVGIIAAQSVGEPSTQMTLNTFHLAGVGSKNVTLGIPRLVEILMIAGKTIKTPVMKVDVDEQTALAVIDKTKRKTLQDVVKSVKIEENGNNVKIEINMTVNLNKKEIESKIMKMIDKTIRKKNKFNVIDYNETKESCKETENEEKDQNESDDESESEEKIKIEEEDELVEMNEKENSDVSSANNELEHKETNIKSDVIFIEFDILNNNLLILPVLEKIFQQIVVQEWNGIRNSTYADNTLIVEGSDLFSLINLLSSEIICKTYTNDIYSVIQTLGVEAARYVIVNEIVSVFDVYGIKIDIRHLMLIADFMTKDGTYKPFNRYGMKHCRSLLQKMCFESCFSYLKEGVLFGDTDFINNPSSELCVGKKISIGSNANFELKYIFEDE